MLLRYHDYQVYKHISSFELEPECYATSWILTNFSRNVSDTLIYELISIILHEKDHLFILFLIVALLKVHRDDILATDTMEDCLMTLKKRTKIKSLKKLSQVYFEAVDLRSSTPTSFSILVAKLNLFNLKGQLQNIELLKQYEDTIPLFVDDLLY